MAVDASIASLLEKLKVEDPYFPPRPWESIPSESGIPSLSSLHSEHSSNGIFATSRVSESSLVRLALNALQGVESALISIGELSYLFCSDSADRSFHCIPSLWTRSSSTLALGNLLKSIGRIGSIIFLLQKFVCYFTSSSADCKSGPDEILGNTSSVAGSCQLNNHTLVNQAFAVAVGKVLEGYISALNSLLSSVSLRRSSKTTDGGCLTSVGNSEITVLEVYLHTMGLRAQMEALGNICNLCDLALCFPELPLKDLMAKADLEFHNFPRSGALITFLYSQLKAADPVHCALLKFLFLRSWEPYCGFIRSWIYEGRINDPFKEFVVELFGDLSDHAVDVTGTCNDFPLASVKVRDGVAVPIFLEDFLIPLFRAGQQLQVIMKLLELSNNIGAINGSYEEFLPGCNGFSSKYPRFSSSLTFDKGTIEAIVLARSTFYLQILEKIDNIFSKFEFRPQGISPYGVQTIHADCGRSLKSSELVAVDDNLIMSPSERKTQELPDSVSEVSTTEDEFSYAEDVMESSESSSLENFEEQSESEDLTYITDKLLEPSYFSALSFFTNDSLQKLPQDEISCNSKPFLDEKCERKDNSGYAAGIYHIGKVASEHALAPTVGEQSLVLTPDTKGTEVGCQLSDHILKNPFDIDRRNNENSSFLTMVHKLKVSGDSQMTEMLDCGEFILHKNASVQKADSKHQYQDDTFQNSSSFSSWRMKYHSNFFNMNPSLTKSSLVKSKTSPGERWHQKEPLSCFDFTSVRDPCKLYTEKLDYRTTQQFGAELSVLTDSTGTTSISTSDLLDQESHDHKNSEKKGKPSYASSPVSSKTNAKEVSSLANTNGGSGWVSLLGCSNKATNAAARYHGPSLVTVNEIPLDYIIKKCLLDEILLQYKYLSKLTIKLFEKGFDLQEHLLALRRYHFMEVADWADLFITSLLRHKWFVLEAEKRISDIQGVLELSVQRSSCEGDLNRDRLYVYMKDAMATGPFHGIHSFDFLGLGYRVDWPISIILTPGALKIYSEIFSFLIQVKLALISLSDAWSSLKNHTQLSKKNCHFEAQDMKLGQISILTKTRHQLNHCVSAVQQYVQSQLSHVSWCRFMHSLKHKVRDMMDFELVHMAYLNESRHICFLSEETQPIARIIQQILQSAVDFRSSLAGNIFKSGLNEKEGWGDLHQMDMSQVLSIRNTFMKSIKDLYQCYLKSPKHDDFGLSRLWGYINYNEYYTEVIGEPIGLGSFPI